MAAQQAVGGAGAQMPQAILPSHHTVVASGGYGTVVKPALPNLVDGIETTFPGNVTKIFFKDSNLRNIMAKSDLVKAVLNRYEPDRRNAGHNIYAYNKRYTFKNLPNSIKPATANEFRKKGIILNENAPLPLLRMPNLGIDIFGLCYESPPEVIKRLRTIPVPDILAQIYKLFRQTHGLVSSGYIHNDIRDTNVMINPETGEMTIIDFDLFNKITEQDLKLRKHDSNVMYHLPPEVLMYANMNLVEDPSVPIDLAKFIYSDISNPYHEARKAMYQRYLNEHYDHFSIVYKENGVTEPHFISLIETGLTQNAMYIRQQISEGNRDISKRILETVDNFGLAFTLLNLLGTLYPKISYYGKFLLDRQRIDHTRFQEHRKHIANMFFLELGHVIINKDKPYKVFELRHLSLALLDVSYFLHRACMFEIFNRYTSLELLNKIKHVYDTTVHNLYTTFAQKLTLERRHLPIFYPSHAAAAAEAERAAAAAEAERAAAAAEAERAAAAAEAERAAAAAEAERAAAAAEAERAGKITAAALGKTTATQTRRQGRGRLEGLAREYLPKGLANVCFGSHCNNSNDNNNQDGGSRTRRNRRKSRRPTSRQRIFNTRNKRRCARKH